ncbi:MAG: DMT family transporter [Candidatus Saganbacteria bacterium]|nr:DMT family transporter [Candidatus Saganbacteria bacterium]
MEKQNLKLAAIYMVACSAAVSLLGAFIKDFSGVFATYMLVFYRFLGPLILTLIPLLVMRRFAAFKTKRLGMHFLRTVLMLGSNYALFFALASLALTDATLLWNTSPLFIPILSMLFLKEKIKPKFWVYLAIAFCGVLLILRPGTGIFNLFSLIGLAAGFFMAASSIALRSLSETESVDQCMFFFLSMGTAMTIVPILLFGWQGPGQQFFAGAPGAFHLLSFLALGVFSWAMQYYMTRAYSLASPSILGPLLFISIPVSAVIDWLFWGNIIDMWTVAGAILLFIGASLILRQTKNP